ncbi:MAG: MASE1 domain-containing protein [Burkholderiales bacterium]
MPVAANQVGALSNWAKPGALALAYLVAAKATLVFAIPPGYATAVWAPSGIALAAMLRWGVRVWPGMWLGAALTNYSIELSVPAALGIASGNALEGICAAWLLAGLAQREAEFRRPEQVFRFIAIAAAASVVAATVGVSSLLLSGKIAAGQYGANWYTWWQGDCTGILLVTPCLLAWTGGACEREGRAGAWELVAFAAMLAVTLSAVFAHNGNTYDARPLVFLAVPFFVWAACRFSGRAVTLTVLAVSGSAIWCTVNGLGPFQRPTLNEALLMLQAFTGTGALVALALLASLRRRSDALQRLQASHSALGRGTQWRIRDLSRRIEEHRDAQTLARCGSWTWDPASNRLRWSEELCQIFGIEPLQFAGSFEDYFVRVHPADRERVRSAVKDAYAKHGKWDSTERIVRPDGKTRLVRSIGRMVLSKDDPPAYMHGVIFDITDEGAGEAT